MSADQEPTSAAEEHQPTGTMTILLLFLVLMAVMWGFTYLLLLDRG